MHVCKFNSLFFLTNNEILCWREMVKADLQSAAFDMVIFFFRGSGLPQSGSWQDLKDHMREAGDVCYADVYRDGTGVVEFVRKEDMTYAVRKLDNTKFRSHEVCVAI